jgi:dUTP pyrophosphatase
VIVQYIYVQIFNFIKIESQAQDTIAMIGPSTETVYFKKLHVDAVMPSRATPCSAGFDLCSIENVLIVGGQGNVKIRTGIAVKLPEGTYGRIASRSGLSARHHMNVSAGVIDRDYSGEIIVLVNVSKIYDDNNAHVLQAHQCTIQKGERFAQLIIEKISYAPAELIDDVKHENMCEHSGFGSTGTGIASD